MRVMFFGGGVVIKLGDEVIGSIGASGALGAKLDDACAKAGQIAFLEHRDDDMRSAVPVIRAAR